MPEETLPPLLRLFRVLALFLDEALQEIHVAAGGSSDILLAAAIVFLGYLFFFKKGVGGEGSVSSSGAESSGGPGLPSAASSPSSSGPLAKTILSSPVCSFLSNDSPGK